MKASELRIGNLIQKHNGQIFTVTAEFIVEYEKYAGERLLTIPPKPLYSPIPLSEEWPLKIGLKYYEEISTEDFFGGALYHYEDEWVIMYDNEVHFIRDRSSSAYDGSTEYRTTKIEYVHQLQNLYHSLTGEELNLRAIYEPTNTEKHVTN